MRRVNVFSHLPNAQTHTHTLLARTQKQQRAGKLIDLLLYFPRSSDFSSWLFYCCFVAYTNGKINNKWKGFVREASRTKEAHFGDVPRASLILTNFNKILNISLECFSAI
jgi:hypothetical protein